MYLKRDRVNTIIRSIETLVAECEKLQNENDALKAPGLHKITDALADEPDPFDVIETLQARIARLEDRCASWQKMAEHQSARIASLKEALREIVECAGVNLGALSAFNMADIARRALASDGEGGE